MSVSGVNRPKEIIPLEEIKLATENFRSNIYIVVTGKASVLYRGQLSEHWNNHKVAFKRFKEFRGHGEKGFLNELKLISSIRHENIIPFIGYCNEDNEMIIVYEDPVSGSLADHLHDPEKRSRLTWEIRLQICLGAAKGVNYLHSGLSEHGKIIHGSDIKSNILLYDNMNAKLSGFTMSALITGNQPRPGVYKPAKCEKKCEDPIYLQTGYLRPESDIFSIGLLLLDMLTGREAYDKASRYIVGQPTKSRYMLFQSCYDLGLENFIDQVISDQIGSQSFHLIKEIARKCISCNIKNRPAIDRIIETIQEALDFHNREADTNTTRGSSSQRQIQIPFEEIKWATRNFARYKGQPECRTYEGKLSEQWDNRTVVIKQYGGTELQKDRVLNERYIVSKFHHENIIPYIGHCDDSKYMFLVFEHPINGSLDSHLKNPNKRRFITWEQRLTICIGAARGLRFLHSGLCEEGRVVIHAGFSSRFIFLNEDMEAKIWVDRFSMLVPKNHPQGYDDRKHSNKDREYIDPYYQESNIINVEVDVYSFGVVMFEILSGLLASVKRIFDDGYGKQDLITWVHRYYADELDKLIDPDIRDQINGRSLHTFVETAYRCLSYNKKERPSMNRIIKRLEEALYIQNHEAADSTTTIRSQQYQKLEDLQIPLQDIVTATQNFTINNKIGEGGFGMVYKGRLSEHWQHREAAFKRHNKTAYQGNKEFRNELELTFRFHHPNIIAFVGYCDEGNEMILVYDYAINGSLDNHLQGPNRKCQLTWVERLKICFGAAKGLDYLHTGLGEDNKVIHRDIKSGNILLDKNLEAMICDFGLSKLDSGNKQQQSKFYTKVAGTGYYTDPIYHESGILRTESDVYSFGVVMFEILSGTPAWRRRSFNHDKPQPLVNLVRRYYDYGKDLLIDPQIKDQIDTRSFHTFIDIAYKCISFNSKERPTMETVIDKIEEALDFQMKKEVSSK